MTRLAPALLSSLLLAACAAPTIPAPSSQVQTPPPNVSSAPVTPSAPPVGESPAPPPGPWDGGAATRGWRLAWRDEFTSLDLDTWRPNWLTDSDTKISTPVNRLEKACFDPKQVRVKGGSLRLTAVKRSCRTWDGKRFRYASGLVQSSSDRLFRYGYIEARVYLPPADGSLAARDSCGPNWAVFMLNGRRFPNDGEIDVMECLSDDNASWHFHYGTEKHPKVQRRNYDDPDEMARWESTMPHSGWHRFGVDWRKGRMDFYYDGTLVGSVVGREVPTSKHYLVFGLALSDKKIAVPQTMRVDYVRIYERKNP